MGNRKEPFAVRLKRIEGRKQQEREANPNYVDPATVSRSSGLHGIQGLPLPVLGGGALIMLVGAAVLASVVKSNMTEVSEEIEQRLQEAATLTSPSGQRSTEVATKPGASNPVFVPPRYRPATTQEPRFADRNG